MTQFAKTISDLLTGLDGEVAFQGPGANALSDLISTYLDGEEKLAGSFPDLLQGRLLDASVICEKYAHQLIDNLHLTRPGAHGGKFSASGSFPFHMDDGGNSGVADPVADETAPTLLDFSHDLVDGPINEELPPTPQLGPKVQVDPTLAGNYADFWKMLGIVGIAAGGTAILAAGAIVITNLTADQESLARRLYATYGSSDLSLDDVRSLIGDNPNLTEDQLRQLLNQYSSVIAAHPNLVKQYGALAVFHEFVALAAYDAGHGGDYLLRKPVQNMPNVQPGMEEATAEMGTMENGEVPWPLTPSQATDYDATDPTGQKWDEKSYRSVDTNGNAYDAANTVNKLQKDFGKGEKIIFDDSRLTQREIDETYDNLKRNHQENDVVWWPTKPT